MANDNSVQNWYRLEPILRYETAYRLIIGERSNGKTYAVKKYVIMKYITTGEKFIYLRRRHEQITQKDMKALFKDLSDWCLDVLGDFIHYTAEYGFYIERDGERVSIGYAKAIEDAYSFKGIPFNDITTIFFDEFLEVGTPIQKETVLFMNSISTICRKRTNVEIFMVGNTIAGASFSVYFNLFGIDIKKLKQGHFYYFKHKMGVDGVIEYCESTNIDKLTGEKTGNRYIGFDDDPTSKMMLYGEWEYDIVNTKEIDGIGWKAKRRLIPLYITALDKVYELSIYEGDDPIAFVRCPNTQAGMVSEKIRYNLSYDNSIKLVSKSKIIPCYGKLNGLIDADVREMFKLFLMCIEAKRVVYQSMPIGSDFNSIIGNFV